MRFGVKEELNAGSVDLLGSFKCKFKVGSPVLRFQGGEIESVRVEVMDERAESHSVRPAAAKVFHLHMLHQTVEQNMPCHFITQQQAIYKITC